MFHFLMSSHQVKPSDYMEMISSLKPNLWASLADEVPAWVTEKRNKASVDRTIRWLDDCLSLDKVCKTGLSFMLTNLNFIGYNQLEDDYKGWVCPSFSPCFG